MSRPTFDQWNALDSLSTSEIVGRLMQRGEPAGNARDVTCDYREGDLNAGVFIIMRLGL